MRSIYISFRFDEKDWKENRLLVDFRRNTTLGLQISKPSSSSSGPVAIQLADDMEGRDEPYKAKAHDQYDRGRNLETRCIVCVEPKHVASATATPKPSSSAATAASARRPSASKPSRGSGAAAGRSPRWTSSGDYRRGLRLRGTSRHRTVWFLPRKREIESFRISGVFKDRSKQFGASIISFAILWISNCRGVYAVCRDWKWRAIFIWVWGFDLPENSPDNR